MMNIITYYYEYCEFMALQGGNAMITWLKHLAHIRVRKEINKPRTAECHSVPGRHQMQINQTNTL